MFEQAARTKLYWMGKEVEELSRGELLDLVMHMNQQITLAMDATSKLVRMHEAAKQWKEKNHQRAH
jgi:hypothetical protein